MQHIIVTGNPCDGFIFWGPFSSHEEALEYANTDLPIVDSWWIAPMNEPMINGECEAKQ